MSNSWVHDVQYFSSVQNPRCYKTYHSITMLFKGTQVWNKFLATKNSRVLLVTDINGGTECMDRKQSQPLIMQECVDSKSQHKEACCLGQQSKLRVCHVTSAGADRSPWVMPVCDLGQSQGPKRSRRKSHTK